RESCERLRHLRDEDVDFSFPAFNPDAAPAPFRPRHFASPALIRLRTREEFEPFATSCEWTLMSLHSRLAGSRETRWIPPKLAAPKDLYHRLSGLGATDQTVKWAKDLDRVVVGMGWHCLIPG